MQNKEPRLYCLFPVRLGRYGVVAEQTYKTFIDSVKAAVMLT